MGQASRRGTFEERKAQAIERQQKMADILEFEKQKRFEQECLAEDLMVWWQRDMSRERYLKSREDYMHLMEFFTIVGTMGGRYSHV